MKLIKKILDAIAYPFIAFYVLVDETRIANLEDDECKRLERKTRRRSKR